MDIMYNLACTYCSMCDLARAASMFHEALILQRRVLGEQHPVTVRCGLRLACVLLRTGRVFEAQPLIAAASAACACSKQPPGPNAASCVFVRALGKFYAGQMEAQGLQAALDTMDSSDEVNWMQCEYNAAVTEGRRCSA